MSTRKTPYALSDSDRKNLTEAREALIRVRDFVPLIVRERFLANDGTVMEPTEAMKARKDLSENFINEMVADIEFLMGYTT